MQNTAGLGLLVGVKPEMHKHIKECADLQFTQL
jgi:hypothetical protein